MQLTTLFATLSIVACAGAPREAGRGGPGPAAPAPAALHTAAVAELVGVWQGRALGTPFGDFPFAIAFDREAGGDVHGRLDGGPGMYLDFRFRRQLDRWML